MTDEKQNAARSGRGVAAREEHSGSEMRRRRYLAAAGGLIGTGIASGCAGPGDWFSEQDGAESDQQNPGPVVRTGDRTDFIWLTGGVYGHDRMYENVLAFARRHGLPVIISRASTTHENAEAIRAPLETAADRGVTAWLATGCFRDGLTAEAIARDEDARAEHVARLTAMIERYQAVFPDGKVICWHEEPLVSHWVPSGEWNERAVMNMEQYGPAIFAAQKRAIADVSADIDVGIFVHYPYIVDDAVFSSIADDLEDRDALPDFTFTDYYRGYTEPDGGYEAANEATRSLITNARKHTNGRPVYNLGQDHTINTNYTPSKAAIRGHLRAALSVDVDGLGWYIRGLYRPTEQGFNPFVPNEGEVPNRDVFSTLTGSRDRFQYAYRTSLETLNRFDPDQRFDLWITGRDLRHYEHRLEAKTADGEWEFLCDLYGYVDGDNPYAGAGRTSTSIVHALDRDRFLDGRDEFEVRVTTDPDSDGAALAAVSAVPYDTGSYLTELEAVSLATETSDFAEYTLGHGEVDVTLDPEGSRVVTVPLADDGDPTPLRELRYPDHRSALAALEAAESADDFAPDRAFDLWIAGEAIEPNEIYVEYDGERLFLSEHAVTASATETAVVFNGLDRARRTEVEAGIIGVSADGGSDGTLERLYAMPYFGSDNFKTPETAAELIDSDDSLPTFALFSRTL